MLVDIYVFQTKLASSIIKRIEKQGYNVFFSNESNQAWLKHRFPDTQKHRIYYDEYCKSFTTDYLPPDTTPFICVSTPETLDEMEWNNVDKWVWSLLWPDYEDVEKPDLGFELGFEKPMTLIIDQEPQGEEIIFEGLKRHVVSTPPTLIDAGTGYKFDCFYDETNDTKYYEIYAPQRPTPFTVVVHNFSKKDDSFVFTDIFASSAWASNMMECRYDFHFLTVLWKHLKMPGEFTFEVLKKRVDACYPDRVKDINDLLPEPTLYRREMRQVMEMKRKRQEGHSF